MAELALVVDDDEGTQHLIARAIRDLGIIVAPFFDAESALAKLTMVRPSYALLDVSLPKMSGIELAHRIRDDVETRTLPLVLMSATDASVAQYEREAMELGALFLAKPFRLPVLREAIRELREEVKLRPVPRRKPRVLIVDDDPGILDALRLIVGDEGFEAVCAADAFEALSLCGSTAPRPDVAVIDVMLPGLDGPSLATRLKATSHFSRVPIVMMSAFDSVHEEASRVGAVATLKKPFDLDHFIDVVRKSVERAS